MTEEEFRDIVVQILPKPLKSDSSYENGFLIYARWLLDDSSWLKFNDIDGDGQACIYERDMYSIRWRFNCDSSYTEIIFKLEEVKKRILSYKAHKGH